MLVVTRFAVLVLALSACGDSPQQEPATAERGALTAEAEPHGGTPSTDPEGSTNSTAVAVPEDEQPGADPSALPTKMGRRLSNQLRQLVGARVALPQVVSESQADGGSRVLGVMSFSENEACVGRYEDRAEGRAACREEADCIQYGAVIAEFASPGPRTPEGHGGALTVISPQSAEDMNVECAESIEVRRLEAVDIDRDGQIELVYDAIFYSEHDAFRGGGTYQTARRILRVIRMDGSDQLTVLLSEWGGDAEATGEQYARRARFELKEGESGAASQRSANPALIVDEVGYESAGGTTCVVDEGFFATDYQNEDEAECTGELVTLVRPYDAECDCWRTAGESATAAGSGATEPGEAQPGEAVEATPMAPGASAE